MKMPDRPARDFGEEGDPRKEFAPERLGRGLANRDAEGKSFAVAGLVLLMAAAAAAAVLSWH